MIINPDTQRMTTEIPHDSPPSYETATDDGNDYTSHQHPKGALNSVSDAKRPISETSPLNYHPGPSHSVQPGYPTMLPPVHQYVNPATGQQLTSLLPPNDPEMICLQQGTHVLDTKYGVLGILAAIFWFPLGIGLCLLDRRTECKRCGAVLNNGLCI